MEDYYPDELPALFEAYAQLHGAKGMQPPQRVDVMTFLNL